MAAHDHKFMFFLQIFKNDFASYSMPHANTTNTIENPHHTSLFVQNLYKYLEVNAFMARMFVTLEIMPDDPGTSLETLKEEAKELIEEKEGKVLDKRTEFKPIAFGLKALVMTFSVDETK